MLNIFHHHATLKVKIIIYYINIFLENFKHLEKYFSPKKILYIEHISLSLDTQAKSIIYYIGIFLFNNSSKNLRSISNFIKFLTTKILSQKKFYNQIYFTLI